MTAGANEFFCLLEYRPFSYYRIPFVLCVFRLLSMSAIKNLNPSNEFHDMKGDPDDWGFGGNISVPSRLPEIAALSHRTPDRHLALTQNVQTSYSQPHCFISLLVSSMVITVRCSSASHRDD